MKIKLVSIGITCFNAKETINNAVLSALSQDYPNKEIIIVDDASTDGSHNILKALAEKYNEVQLIIHRENKGVAAARNTIINSCKGEFLVFMDDDDTSEKNRCTEQVRAIVEYEQKVSLPVICHSARIQEYKSANVKRIEKALGEDQILLDPNSVITAILIGNRNMSPGSLATCSQAARVKSYKALDGFDAFFQRSEDFDFILRAAKKNFYFVSLSSFLVKQAITPGEEKRIEKEYYYLDEIFKKHKALIGSEEWYIFLQKWNRLKFMVARGKWLRPVIILTGLLLMHPVKTVKKIIWAQENTESRKSKRKIDSLFES